MEASKTIFPSIKDVPAESWQKLSEKKIYFGHQSVGFNIMEGVKDVMKDNPQIKLKIAETTNPSDLEVPLFAHSTVGKNLDPQSKCDAFSRFLTEGIGDKVDIAFFKLCYVDIGSGTNVREVFESYKTAIQKLKSKYPSVVFVHITSPLTMTQTGPKEWIKKVIGKPIDGYDDNIKREEYNTMLRKEYRGKEPLFDLANVESTLPNGFQSLFEKNGTAHPRLAKEYTNDGGHLNRLGRKRVADQLLIFLAKLQ